MPLPNPKLLRIIKPVVALIDSKALGMGHARALLGLRGNAERQRLGQLVAQRGLSVRETENLVRKTLEGAGTAARKPPESTVVSEVLRTKTLHVQLQQRTQGSGKIVIEFADSAARDQLLDLIRSLKD